MSDLAELLERVKAATGHSLDLDHAIHDALLNGVDGAPLYTGSLDAALGLVERVRPGLEFGISRAFHRKGWAVKSWLSGDTYGGRLFDAPTPALALLAALLTALSTPAPEELGPPHF